jgi:DNA-binding NtrC family response regulator
VEDDDPIRHMLSTVIERLDVDVDTARDGEEAIRRLDSDHYAVVLLDLMMPRVDGYAVLSHMQSHYPEVLGRTIIASAIPDSEVHRRVDAPVYRTHSKPFDITALMNDVERCVHA